MLARKPLLATLVRSCWADQTLAGRLSGSLVAGWKHLITRLCWVVLLVVSLHGFAEDTTLETEYGVQARQRKSNLVSWCVLCAILVAAAWLLQVVRSWGGLVFECEAVAHCAQIHPFVAGDRIQ